MRIRNENFKNILKEELGALYIEHGSLKAVGRAVGVDCGTVKRYMQKYDLYFKPQVRYDCDHNFFSQDTEESFYVAGFIAADGSIGDRKNPSGKTRPVLSIGLSKKDKEFLQMLVDTMKAENPIHDYLVNHSKHNPNWNDIWKSEVKITSRQMVEDLKRFNIVPRKTHIYTFPEWIIDHPLCNHFIRGYFDGDGCFNTALGKGKKTEQFYFSVRGTEKFLSIIEEILYREIGTNRKSPRLSSGQFTIGYGGNGIFRKIFEFLYKDASIYMERKYQIGIKVYDYEQKKYFGDILTKELLESKYEEYGCLSGVANDLNVNQVTVLNYMKKYNLKLQESPQSKNERFKTLLSMENLSKVYSEKISIAATAKELGVGKTTIRRYLDKYGIKVLVKPGINISRNHY